MSILKILREGIWVAVGIVALGLCFEYEFEWYYFLAAVVTILWGVKDIAAEIRDGVGASGVAEMSGERDEIAARLEATGEAKETASE